MKRLSVVLAAVAMVVLLCGLAGWGVVQALTRRADAEVATATSSRTPVEVYLAAPRDMVDEVKVAGTLRALHEADVMAEVPGRVVAILAEVGANVAKGEGLARLDSEDLALQVRQAEAGLAAAKAGRDGIARDLVSAKLMTEAGGKADAQLAGAKSRAAVADAQVEQAEAGLGMARSRLADAQIRAPFAGVVVRRGTDIGSQVGPGAPVFAVADLSELELVLDVDERIAAGVKAGDAVGLTSDTVAGLADGVVKTVSPMLDAQSHKARIIVGLAYTPGLFGHGGATATFRLGRAEGVVAVPSGAVTEDRGEKVVYVVAGEVAHRTAVGPGLRDGDWVALEGVTAGAAVVVTGNAYLSDGSAVTVRTAGAQAAGVGGGS